MRVFCNWLKDAEKFTYPNGGVVYVGKCPFHVDKHKQEHLDRLYNVPWVISHPDAKEKIWKLVGFESFCLPWIREGGQIALHVEEWEEF